MAFDHDVLAKLQEFKWRGLSFPVESVDTDIQQDLAYHLRPDQDGGRIEATGRRPITIHAKCIFFNGTVPGRNETWSSKTNARVALYPDIYREFMNAIADRSTGELVHPSLGPLQAKVVNARSLLTGTRRDGETVDVSWVETNDDDGSPSDLFQNAQPISVAMTAARDLDREVVQAQQPVKDAAGPVSFETMMRQVQAVVDTQSLISRKQGGLVDRVVYRAEQTADAFTRLADPQQWPGQRAAQRLIEAARIVQQTLLQQSRQTKIYINPRAQTLVALAHHLRNPVADVVNLNPSLVKSPFVAPRVPIRYYAS